MLAVKVATRYKQAQATVALRNLVLGLVKSAGGEAFVQRYFDPDMMPAWDKDEFYRRDGAERLLDELFDIQGSVVASKLEPLWDRISYKNAGFNTDSSVLKYSSETITLTLEVDGPTFSKFGDDEGDDEGDAGDDEGDAGDDVEWGRGGNLRAPSPPPDHNYDKYHNFIEIPDDEAFLDDEIDEFGKALGAAVHYSKTRESDWTYPEVYDYYKYDVRLTWKVDPEALVRLSFGKIVDQAGQSFQWTGEDAPAPLVIPNRTTVIIESQKGWDRGSWKKGQLLEIVRGGRSGSVVSARTKGIEGTVTFRLRVDKRGLFLMSGVRDEKELKVSIARGMRQPLTT